MRMVDNDFFYEKPPDPSCKIKKMVYSKDADGVNKANTGKQQGVEMRANHASDTAKHFTADELYEIALDEYQKAGRHIGQSERMGLTQWAYWSAETTISTRRRRRGRSFVSTYQRKRATVKSRADAK